MLRSLIYGVTMLLGFAMKMDWFTQQSVEHVPRAVARPDFTLSGKYVHEPISPPRPSFSASAADASVGDAPYKGIVERNPFDLKPPAPPPPSPAPAVEPKGDLFLTGMIGLNGHLALFMMTEPGQPSVYFMLREGEENSWLAVESVNLLEGTVTARLKQPVMRIRNVGAEVILSFQAHGVKIDANR